MPSQQNARRTNSNSTNGSTEDSLKMNSIKKILNDKVRKANPAPKIEKKPRSGNGISLGKQEDSLAYRTKLNKFTTWETTVLPDDERIEQTALLRKMRERDEIINHTKRIMDGNRYGHDSDKTFMLMEGNIPNRSQELATSRNSTLRDINSLNVVSRNGKRVTSLNQLY